MRHAIIIILILAFPVIAHGATLEVPSSFPTIQAAINVAVNGDTVLVAPGTYVENIDFIGKLITVKSDQGPEVTIIDGGQAGSVVTFQSYEGPDAVLDWFTITNGSGTYEGNKRFGGGIYCRSSSPIIKNNIITDNQVDGNGGGIWSIPSSASPNIRYNDVKYNSARHGGGICCSHGSPVISNNKILENEAYYNSTFGNGGGIHCISGSTATIENNTFNDNTAGGGGGLYCYGANPTINNNLFICNHATQVGGGVTIYDSSSTLIFQNNTITGNVSEVGGWGGGGGLCVDSTEMTARNLILWNDSSDIGPEISLQKTKSLATLHISYSDVEGGQNAVFVAPGCTLNWGPGMIDANPLFVDFYNDQDCHIQHGSPCRDTGDPNTSGLPAEDWECDPRVAWNGIVDMGADEFHTHLYWTGDATPGGNVELKFVGLPGTSPVGLCIGTGVLDPPLKSMWGDWYLKFPIFGPIVLPGSIPSTGVMVIPGMIPGTPSGPYSIPMQAIIVDTLTNLSVMRIF